jgi:hypothetical protein
MQDFGSWKSRETDSPIDPPEETSPDDTFNLPMRLILHFESQNCNSLSCLSYQYTHKKEGRKEKQVRHRGGYHWERGGHKEGTKLFCFKTPNL